MPDTPRPAPLPVVLLHALPLASPMWDAPARALRARGHTVLTPDQRGFGATPLGAEPPSLETVADDLAALLDEHGIREVALAGCSMGGYVAMTFLRRHPGRVRALALFAARAAPDTPQAAAERRRFADLMLDDTLRDQLVARTTPLLLGAGTRERRPDLVEEVLTMAKGAAPEAVAWAQRAIAERPGSLPVLRVTDIPALVVTGAEDELVTAQDAATTAEALPRGRLVTLPGAGHLQPLEAPDQVTDLLTALLDDATTPDRNGYSTC
ncbi:alpha/beta hydrolase [Streptomyces sp. ASQP_92]|uniref:alpha/beta fold hydrolase n=1 Tax=Streptomyces sp. ASQP_92 TaxID=2979116 RepID=UPI0021C20B16|nr:alpha/beta hydrolase [Streptomyces sp. ASQP_92]MCT9090705.1 alpha/beta hydrolase [Streptomyces sp. ASQP_92]